MRILIVKLGALGDVLRTTPLVTALRRKHADARIHWIVDASCAGVLEKNRAIDDLHRFGPDTQNYLGRHRFELAVNLDKEPEALDAIAWAQASVKKGFGRSADGALCALDRDSDYALRLGIDDELKFRTNQKSYQAISFEQVGLRFDGEDYAFDIEPADQRFADDWLSARGLLEREAGRPLIGLNTGSGHRFAGKKLSVPSLIELAGLLRQRLNARVLLLGGEAERSRNAEIASACEGIAVDSGSHSIDRFAALVKRCTAVVSGDTTAMHIAIAVRTPVVVHFGSTSAPEIELYGRGRKIVSELSCAPCYKRDCPIGEACMARMSPEAIVDACAELLAAGRAL